MFPPPHFWFTGSALFTIGSFALFAVLGFTGIAHMSATYRKLLVGGYVIAFALGLLGWWQSAQQEEASASRDNQFSAVQSAISKIANSADVSLNQSADEIAKAVIAKIQPLQKQVDILSQRPNDELYQDGMQLARVAGIRIDDARMIARFDAVTANQEMNFNKEIEFQNMRLSCKSDHGPSAYMKSGLMAAITYTDVACNILGPRE